MKDPSLCASLIAITIFCMVGCGSKSRSPGSKQVGSGSGATVVSKEDFKQWKLPDGDQFDCWISGDDHAGKPSWICRDINKGPVSYRIVSAEGPGDWKQMRKITVTDDGKVVPDDTSSFGANELLPTGKYAVEFKIGEHVFSAVTLNIR